MKALIISDSHKDFKSIQTAVDNNSDISLIIHAGDVQQDVEDILCVYPNIPCAYVLGNNDFNIWGVPYDRFFEFCGKKIFLTHGHNYGVKLSNAAVIKEAKNRGADVCIFGHTHSRFLQNDGLLVVNPGPSYRGYAVLSIENGEIKVEFKDL